MENNVIAVRKSKPIFIEKVSHSPHDASYTGMKLIIADHPSPCGTVTLITNENVQKYVLNSLPWHITGTIAFIIDSDKVKNKNDIGADAWRWTCTSTKTYSTSDLYSEEKYKE